jgi:hypothetical protein
MNQYAASPVTFAVEETRERPFEHRLKEKFHQFQFNFYKEREMSDFRKLLLAFAAATLMTGIASAQVTPPIVCSTTAQPLTVRAEGLAEQTGDIVINCTGGTVPTIGSALPQVNISVTLTTNITSRLVSDPLTEALLFIDDPQPAAQSPCAGTNAVCAPLTAGANGTAVDASGTVRNIFQGTRQSDNTIVFLAVPINAPGSVGTRIFRTKNIRAAIAGASAQNGQIFAFVSIQNPPANLQLNNSSVNVAFVQQGLQFALRSANGGGFSASAASVALFQCDSVNFNLFGSNTARYGGSGSRVGRSFTARFRENYAASWKVRDVNFPLTEPGAQQNIPQNNNGADPSVATVVESGFYNTGFTSTNGLNRAGRADHGTRLRLAFSNVPANVRVYVSVHALATGTLTTDGNNRQSLGGETTAYTAAYGVSSTAAGLNVAAGTVLANPTSDTELVLGGNTARYPAGAVPGAIEVPLTSGAGSFVWEVFGQDPNQIDTASFAVAFAYRSTNNPGTGTVSVNASFAPVGGGNVMSSTASIPRFADQSTALSSASINTCLTTILFPFVSNQAGFDTGIAIANTSADPFGTAPQTGNCELNYYGGTTGGGAAPAKQTTTTPLSGGQTATFTLSSGGTNGIAATPGFQGYIIAVCNFRYAHAFAFVSDVGAQKLSHGYLALILDPRVGLGGEALDN